MFKWSIYLYGDMKKVKKTISNAENDNVPCAVELLNLSTDIFIYGDNCGIGTFLWSSARFWYGIYGFWHKWNIPFASLTHSAAKSQAKQWTEM